MGLAVTLLFFVALGFRRSHGRVPEGLVLRDPYRMTHNPQATNRKKG